MQTSVINLLLDAMGTTLQQELITEISDETKAGLVYTGTLRESPVDARINILPQVGDDKWRHIINADGKGFQAPLYEIGGSSGHGNVNWRRRFMVEIKIYLDGEPDRVQARRIAQVVLSRAESALRLMTLPAIDDFGELAYLTQVVSSYLEEGGDSGIPIWRGQMYLEFFTTKN